MPSASEALDVADPHTHGALAATEAGVADAQALHLNDLLAGAAAGVFEGVDAAGLAGRVEHTVAVGVGVAVGLEAHRWHTL